MYLLRVTCTFFVTIFYTVVSDANLSVQQSDIDVVTTKNGQIRGSTQTDKHGSVFQTYLGVPYAQPPVGNLRLEKPVPMSSWTGVRNATAFGHICMQPKKYSKSVEPTPQWAKMTSQLGLSEDCLYLNIYVPGRRVQHSVLSSSVEYRNGRIYLSLFTCNFVPQARVRFKLLNIYMLHSFLKKS